MCSIFEYNISTEFSIEHFGLSLDVDLKGRALPYTNTPIVISNKDNNFQIKTMNFSLVPHWSKEKKVKFATHNARLFGEDGSPIFTKPSWKIPFQKNHCLVIMDSFLESVHEGPYAGNIIAFKQKNAQPLIAAGIFDQWIDKSTGEVLESFSILTHEPPKFVIESGHDRCPVFLNDDAILKWPRLNSITAKEQLDYLVSNIKTPELNVTIDRPLKNYKAQTEFKF